jgi:hypothetical protein
MYEYENSKAVEVIIRRGRRNSEKMEGINKSMLYLWKCHNKTPVQHLYTSKNVLKNSNLCTAKLSVLSSL